MIENKEGAGTSADGRQPLKVFSIHMERGCPDILLIVQEVRGQTGNTTGGWLLRLNDFGYGRNLRH